MKKLWSLLIILALIGIAVVVYEKKIDVPADPVITQVPVTRGDIVQATTSTGTLQARRTVDIGTQVSGTVLKMYADFNSIVHKGDLIAELDPSILQAKLNSDQASLEQTQIALKQHQLTLAVDQKNLDRTTDLFEHALESEQNRDAARLQVANDQAQITQDNSAIEIARVKVKQDQIDLGYCRIFSPIDGVVVQRAVDEGQTVAARVSAPTLYTLATNLEELQLLAEVDEADVSSIRPGQKVTFTVQAYPKREFTGTVESVRLNATTSNSVVTYQVVIAAPNPDLQLRPGMTASLSVEIWRASDVLRVPSDALKFRPTRAVFEAFGQQAPATVRLVDLARARANTAATAVSDATPVSEAGHDTIDGLFAPVPRPQGEAQVWVLDQNRQLRAVPVKVGLTDGTWTQVLSGDLRAGEQLVTSIVLPGAAGPTTNPLVPGRFGRGRFGGMRPGGFDRGRGR
jgi:HlyD family secretion protein